MELISFWVRVLYCYLSNYWRRETREKRNEYLIIQESKTTHYIQVISQDTPRKEETGKGKKEAGKGRN